MVVVDREKTEEVLETTVAIVKTMRIGNNSRVIIRYKGKVSNSQRPYKRD